MKISELVTELERIKNEKGDVSVCIFDSEYGEEDIGNVKFVEKTDFHEAFVTFYGD